MTAPPQLPDDFVAVHILTALDFRNRFLDKRFLFLSEVVLLIGAYVQFAKHLIRRYASAKIRFSDRGLDLRYLVRRELTSI